MKNKKGKKLVVLGAMAALLTLIGVSGSQTYAKYVESTTVGAQSATVAKWGFVYSHSDFSNLFGNSYELNSGTLAEVNDTTSLKTVVTSSSDVVAPGTKGSMNFSIVGKAEVDFVLEISTASATDVRLYDKDDTSKEYYPIKWDLALDVDGDTSKSITDGTLQDCVTALDLVKHYPAGSNLNVTATLSWEWAFEVVGNTTIENYQTPGTDVLSYDEADTILGFLSEPHAGTGLEFNYDALAAEYGIDKTVGFADFTISLTQEQYTA